MAPCRALGAACNQEFGFGHGRDVKPLLYGHMTAGPPASSSPSLAQPSALRSSLRATGSTYPGTGELVAEQAALRPC
jgi:hypothetical protein